MSEENFYTVLTAVGKAKIANAHGNRKALELKEMAVGDGGGAYYNPSESAVALKNEVYRRELNNLSSDAENANYLVCEMIIPSTAGGFYVREAGLFDVDGDLIAIGKVPETYKPELDSGAAKDLYMRFVIEVSNAESVTLKINPSVILATKEMSEKAAADAVGGHVAQVNPHNQYLMGKNYTAADVLAKVITVDGEGSGLDADKLDGVELATINAAINSKQPVGDYATNTALNNGLAGKQGVGDYATNTALNNGLNGKENGFSVLPVNKGGTGNTENRAMFSEFLGTYTYANGFHGNAHKAWIKYSHKNDGRFYIGIGDTVGSPTHETRVDYSTNSDYAVNADTVDGWHRDDIRNWNNILNRPSIPSNMTNAPTEGTWIRHTLIGANGGVSGYKSPDGGTWAIYYPSVTVLGVNIPSFCRIVPGGTPITIYGTTSESGFCWRVG